MGVISEDIAPVGAQLGTDVAGRDVTQHGRSWDGRFKLGRRGGPLANVDARFSLPLLQGEAMLEPAPLRHGVRGVPSEVFEIHVLVIEDDEGVAETLGQVRRPMQPETEHPLGDEARARSVGSVEENPDLAELGSGDSQVVEVVLDVVVGAVQRRVPSKGCAAEDRHVAHHVLESRFDLFRPFGRMLPAVRRRDGVVSG